MSSGDLTPGRLRRVRLLISFFVFGLVISGLTAIPLRHEIDLLYLWLGENRTFPGLARWIAHVHRGIYDTYGSYFFMAYGTDWLAFGHLIIALFMVGAMIDPVRNRWLLRAAMISCLLVIPFALVLGQVRGIPLWWRVIDCSFGIAGLVPLYLAWRLIPPESPQ